MVLRTLSDNAGTAPTGAQRRQPCRKCRSGRGGRGCCPQNGNYNRNTANPVVNVNLGNTMERILTMLAPQRTEVIPIQQQQSMTVHPQNSSYVFPQRERVMHTERVVPQNVSVDIPVQQLPQPLYTQPQEAPASQQKRKLPRYPEFI